MFVILVNSYDNPRRDVLLFLYLKNGVIGVYIDKIACLQQEQKHLYFNLGIRLMCFTISLLHLRKKITL